MVTVVYDDDCGFCTWTADVLRRRARDDVDLEFVGFSALDEREELRERLPEAYEDCTHLLLDGDLHSCGAATEQALLLTDWAPEWGGDFVTFLRNFEDYERLREGAYRLVADNRDLLGEVASRESLEPVGDDEASTVADEGDEPGTVTDEADEEGATADGGPGGDPDAG